MDYHVLPYMLGNIASDLDTLLTDLVHVSKQQQHHHQHHHHHHHPHQQHPPQPVNGREEFPCTTGTLHSADTLGKDSFFSSAGNTSRRQGDAVSSNHSLVSSIDDRNDCDSVDSGHDGRCRSGPSPLVFDPHHFGAQFNQRSSPLTARVEVSPSMDELRPISTVERLIKTNSIWLLATLSRAGAVHLLKDRETGNFIVRKSSQPNSLALSVQSRIAGHSTVDHYLIEGTNYGFRLQGSAHFFHSIPALIAYYVENIDEIPYHLRLPSAIQQAKSTRELASLDMLGQDFWVSPLSRKSPSPSPPPELLGLGLHKSCSEPINIQRPANQSSTTGGFAQNTVPSKSASDFSHFMKTQIEMEKYFEQHIQDHSMEEPSIQSSSHISCSAPVNSDANVNSTLVPYRSQANETPPPGGTFAIETVQTCSQSCSYTSKQVTDSGVVSGQSTVTSSIQNSQFLSTSQHTRRLASEDSWVLASSPVTPQQPPQLLLAQTPEVQVEDIYRSNPSNQLATLPSASVKAQHFSSEAQAAQGASSCPVESQHSSSDQVTKDRAWTHPGHPMPHPKSKSNLYFTTNLGLLEIPENSYFTSNLSDKLSDYEDIWRNSCCESDADRTSAQMIRDPRAVFDARLSGQSKKNVKEGKRKVLRKTSKDSPPVRKLVPISRDAVTGGTTGLSALEQARMIAGSVSEDESHSPGAHVTGIQRMENMFEEEPVPIDSPSSPASAKSEIIHSERQTGNTHTPSKSPHQSKFVTSHSLDFTPQQVSESQEQMASFAAIKSLPSSHTSKESASKCLFTTTMSVIISESASSEVSANASKQHDKKSNKKPVPSPLGRLSRLKSSSESSLATVSSPLYAEPADAVKLRDKNGKAINIQVRRRSAPSSASFKSKDKGGKSSAGKVSQNPQLDTIFSPDAQNKHQNSSPKFTFDTSTSQSHFKSSSAPPNISRSISMRTSSEMSQLQRKQSWKDRLNRLKLGTKVLTRNLTPPTAISLRKNLAMQSGNQDLDRALFQEDSFSPQSYSPSSSPSPAKFPVEEHHGPQRASCFSDSSTVQDLISCAHPELSLRPIQAHPLKAGAKTDSTPPSEYDNLMIYRASTHSSQGTVYSPPWETGTANKFIRESPLSTPTLPPAMDFHERIERWQQANSSYHDTSIIKSTTTTTTTTINAGHNNDVNGDEKCQQQLSQSRHGLHIQRQQQQRQLLQHQQQLKVEKTMTSEAVFAKTQDLHHQSVQRQHHQHQQHNHDNDNSSSPKRDKVKKNKASRQDSGSKAPSVPSSPLPTSTTSPTPSSPGLMSSPHRLSSHCPDVVNCHSTPVHTKDTGHSKMTTASGHKMGEDDVLFGGEMPVAGDDLKQRIQPVLNNQMSMSHGDGKSPGAKIREYIFKLSGDRQTIFGSTIENFIQCTMESHETNPQYVMRNVRQFMTGIKNYLVKHGEGELETLIERERNKLGANEILNIDAIIEQALHVCVLKPLKYHIYRLFVEKYSNNGALEQLSNNIKYARTKSAQDIGVKAGLRLPQSTDMEVIKHYLDLMQKSYSPLQKLQNLLKATSTIYHCVQGRHHQFPSRGPSSLGADDFLPVLIYVIIHCGLVSAEIEADFMWGLLQPSLLTGEGGYYLTTLSSAVLILKNFQDTHQLAPAQLEGKLPTLSDMQGFLKIAIPDELHDSITWKTLPVRPNMNTRDVCAMVAHKFKVTNPQDYGLYLLCDGLESQLSDSDCPQLIKGDNQAMGKSCYFAFKRVDANIAWPKHMKHSPITVAET